MPKPRKSKKKRKKTPTKVYGMYSKQGTRDNPKPVKELPDYPTEGMYYEIITNPAASKDGRGKNLGKRKVVFKATGKEGFGKFRIVSSTPAEEET